MSRLSSDQRRISFIPPSADTLNQENSILNDDDKEREEMKKVRERKQLIFERNSKESVDKSNRTAKITSMYAAIIKLANENKINQKNTWNLDLINHMEDVLLDGDDSQGTNFQKASTTLDASVKIYGYRVDDTLHTGYRILDSLSRGEQPKQTTETTKQHHKTGSVNTIETNLRNIEMDSTDLQFSADPLFHLMSRRFDEGGVKGLLLANLSVDNECNVIFDSNQVVEISEQPQPESELFSSSFHTYVDSNELLQSISQSESIESIMNTPICPQLSPLIQEIQAYDSSATDLNPLVDDNQQMEIENPSDVSKSILEDFHIELDEEVAPIPVSTAESIPDAESMEVEEPAAISDVKSTPNKIEKAIMTSAPTTYSYFTPSTLITAWAGPSYWKLRKETKPKKTSNERAPNPRKKRIIEFSKEVSIKPTVSFPPVKRTSDLTISDALFESQGQHILPDDYHFNIDSLQHLECRPDVSLRRVVHFDTSSGASMTPDEWEISPQNVDLGGCTLDNPMDIIPNDVTEMPEIDLDEDSVNMPPPVLETSHAGFISDLKDSQIDDSNGEFGSLLQADRVVEKIQINYANKATQVDIQKLKASIWNVVDSELQNSEWVSFSEMVEKVKQNTFTDTAVQFFFICVLHLANEKGLKLEQSSPSNIRIKRGELFRV